MKTPAPGNTLADALQIPSLGPDPRRLALLETALSGGRETPGQVLALFHSDCGLARMYWQEVQSLRAHVWLGFHEVLVARSRDELRRWIIALQREYALRGAPGPAAIDAAAAERQREHCLRRALVVHTLFKTGWETFDPGTDTDRGVLGVRSIFDRYLLVLCERIFLANLGVLAHADWFRQPIEEVSGLDLNRLRQALEQRWEAAARYFPAVTAPLTAWTAAHAQAGDLYPAQAEIEAQVLEIMRRAGLIAIPTTPLQGAQP